MCSKFLSWIYIFSTFHWVSDQYLWINNYGAVPTGASVYKCFQNKTAISVRIESNWILPQAPECNSLGKCRLGIQIFVKEGSEDGAGWIGLVSRMENGEVEAMSLNVANGHSKWTIEFEPVKRKERWCYWLSSENRQRFWDLYFFSFIHLGFSFCFQWFIFLMVMVQKNAVNFHFHFYLQTPLSTSKFGCIARDEDKITCQVGNPSSNVADLGIFPENSSRRIAFKGFLNLT